jgi:hypothetical protein
MCFAGVNTGVNTGAGASWYPLPKSICLLIWRQNWGLDFTFYLDMAFDFKIVSYQWAPYRHSGSWLIWRRASCSRGWMMTWRSSIIPSWAPELLGPLVLDDGEYCSFCNRLENRWNVTPTVWFSQDSSVFRFNFALNPRNTAGL